jgi:hypothetical protein
MADRFSVESCSGEVSMTNQIRLYVIDVDLESAKSLEAELSRLPQVTVSRSYADAVDASGGLDAVFVPLMSAVEWGIIKLPVPLHQTQIVKMPDYEVARGRPQYAIPGIAISPDESLNPIDTTRLVLRESFKAMRQFNEVSPVKLKAVGVSALSLGLDKLRPDEAGELIRDAYLSSVT